MTDKQNSQTDTIENIITLAARMAISQKHLLENSHRLCYARRQRWIRRGNAALSDVMFGVPHRRTAARRSRDVACYIVPPDTRGRAGGGVNPGRDEGGVNYGSHTALVYATPKSIMSLRGNRIHTCMRVWAWHRLCRSHDSTYLFFGPGNGPPSATNVLLLDVVC